MNMQTNLLLFLPYFGDIYLNYKYWFCLLTYGRYIGTTKQDKDSNATETSNILCH